MGFFSFLNNKNNNAPINEEDKGPLYSNFSTPFGKIGGGNLALPFIRAYSYSEPYVRFGSDNLFSQVINQMYFTSPLNGSIINYKVNAVIGGGWKINSINPTAKEKVDEYSFIKVNKMKKLVRQITKDLIMHGRICIKICEYKNGNVKLERIGPEKVRNNADKSIYSISEDWARSIDIRQLEAYCPGKIGESLYVYEIDGDAGQDYYPIPQYCSALNDAFLDGETPYLMKSNIINSIFPSFMVKVAKKFASEEEKNELIQTINNAKGAPETGRIMLFAANTADQLPTIEEIPMNNIDGVFDSTLIRVDVNIARGHQIDPLLMGIRVTGGIGGQGNELAQAYTIFEKNVVMPLREMITEAVNDLFSIGNLTTTIQINDYQIINNEIIDNTKKIL